METKLRKGRLGWGEGRPQESVQGQFLILIIKGAEKRKERDRQKHHRTVRKLEIKGQRRRKRGKKRETKRK